MLMQSHAGVLGSATGTMGLPSGGKNFKTYVLKIYEARFVDILQSIALPVGNCLRLQSSAEFNYD
jgi:hypothetical protein